MGYRNIQMHAVLASLPPSPAPKQQRASLMEGRSASTTPDAATALDLGDAGGARGGAEPAVAAARPSLLDLCCDGLRRQLGVDSVCEVLEVTDCLAPVAGELHAHAVEYLARHFVAVAAQEGEAFSRLSAGTLAEVLHSQTLVRGRDAVA